MLTATITIKVDGRRCDVQRDMRIVITQRHIRLHDRQAETLPLRHKPGTVRPCRDLDAGQFVIEGLLEQIIETLSQQTEYAGVAGNPC